MGEEMALRRGRVAESREVECVVVQQQPRMTRWVYSAAQIAGVPGESSSQHYGHYCVGRELFHYAQPDVHYAMRLKLVHV
jgi:hypothetical protein